MLLLIFYLCLYFFSFWLLCVSVCSSLVLPCLGLYDSWTWLTISFSMLGMFSAIISSNIFLDPFSRSSSGTPIMQMFMHLMLFLRPLRFSSFLFFCILFYGSDLHHSVQVIYLYFCLIILLWIPSNISIYLFFSFSGYFINISCIFLIFASILFPRSWIIFTIIIQNSFSGKLLISASFSCFSGDLSCPFIWDITFCFFILINFL